MKPGSLLLLLPLLGALLSADDGQRLLRVDHYVRVKSIAPSMTGQISQVYVREVAVAGTALRGSAAVAGGQGVVLFIHGAGTPAEVAFDVPYTDYSWMAFLARGGYDVFAMDMTGYGRSTRPGPMQDPCNLTKAQQAQFVAHGACGAEASSERATTIESDWHDIDGVVDYLRKLRGVEKVNLVGWSLGGPRAGGYAAQHPEKVARMALLSPAYLRNARAGANGAAAQRAPGAPFNTQSRAEFDANWDRQIGCAEQFEMPARESVWAEMLAADPVGATWGTGVRRAPNVATGGKHWNAEAVAKMRVPALFVAAAQDKQVVPEGVRTLHSEYGAPEKVLVDLACSSHNALWERNHLLMFRASLEWFSNGTVNGTASGTVKLGY